MKLILTALLTLVTCLAAHAGVSVITGGSVSPLNGHTYYLTSPGSWADAETAAVSLGGHLATIRNTQEDSWIYSNFLPVAPTGQMWFGLTDRAVEGTWVWVSGEAASYRHWGAGEPSSFWPDEDYAQYFIAGGGKDGMWNSATTTDTGYGVIEVIPEPSTLSLAALVGLAVAARLRKLV